MSQPSVMRDPNAPQEPLVCGEYRLGALLGRGAAGAVYAATSVRDGAEVAVKVRTLAGSGSWRAHERFERSARWLAGLSHPGLPRVIAFEPMGEGAGHDDRAFLVLERFTGGTLHARGRQRLDDASLRALLRGILEPLAVLHVQAPPLVHGDVTPHNVMFRDAEGTRPVLVDCDALTEAAALDEREVTSFVGTPGYVAPEQIAGRPTPASDVYSAAATVLFAATGIDVDGHPRRRGRVDLSSREELSRELRALLGSMLDPDPGARPRDAADALRRLDAIGSTRRARATPIAIAAGGAALVFAIASAHGAAGPRAPLVDPSSPLACRIATDPPGATVYAGDGAATWSQPGPGFAGEARLGATPLTIAREPAGSRPLILHKRGFRPFFLEVVSPREGDPPCAFTAKLVAD